MSGISCIFLLDCKGRILVSRNYRHDLNEELYEELNQYIIANSENLKPIFQDKKGNSYFHL